MKTIYIPDGRTQIYEGNMACQSIIVDGGLIVEGSLTATHITGKGHVDAGSVSARTLTIRSVEAATVVADTLAVERVCAAEVKVTGEALVSSYLEAQYVEAQKLTVSGLQVGELHARELEYLPRKSQSVLSALLGCLFRHVVSFFARLIPRDGEYVQEEARAP